MTTDRLRLIFTCCHPALALDGQVALTLKTLAGLSTAEIARAFLVSEPTMSQRLLRTKRKISNAAIPYRVPPEEQDRSRWDAALIEEGHRHLRRAASSGRPPGPYRLQAQIAACHARARPRRLPPGARSSPSTTPCPPPSRHP